MAPTIEQFAWPIPEFAGLKPVISNPFDYSMVKKKGKLRPKHPGVDIMYRREKPGAKNHPWQTKKYEMFTGIPVCSVGPGRVWGVDKKTGCVIIDHHVVFGFGPLATLYCHLAPPILVKVGDQVETGEILATVGHTNTDIAHLHFAMSTDVKRKWGVDPAPWLASWPYALQPHKLRKPLPEPPLKPPGEGVDFPWWILLLLLWDHD